MSEDEIGKDGEMIDGDDPRNTAKVLREAAFDYETEYGTQRQRDHLSVVRAESKPAPEERRVNKMKTSLYLDRTDVDHLAWLSRVEQRPQAEIIRDAIRAYKPHSKTRRFHLFDTFDGDGRSIADISDEELMAGFGADAWAPDAGADR